MTTTITQNPSSAGLTDITGLMNLLTGQYGAGVTQRKKQYEQGLGRLEQALTTAQGPEFDQLALEQYGRAKTKAVSSGLSRLISSGLMGTTRAAEPERAFEAEVGVPFYKGLAEAKAGRISSALGNISQYQMQFPNIYPEAGTLAYLATGGFGQLSPQQKLAAEELPTLARLATIGGEGGGGTIGGGGTVGGGGGGGGGYGGSLTGGLNYPGGGGGGDVGGGEGGWNLPAGGAGGAGSSFQSPAYTGPTGTLLSPAGWQAAGGQPGPIESAAGLQYAPEVGYGMGVSPVPTTTPSSGGTMDSIVKQLMAQNPQLSSNAAWWGAKAILEGKATMPTVAGGGGTFKGAGYTGTW